jgi:hypothetical protein
MEKKKKKRKAPTSREADKKDLGYYAVHVYAFPLLGKKHDKIANQKKALTLEERAVLTNIEDGEVTGAASTDSGMLLFTTTGLRFYRWDKMCDDSESGKWWSDRKNPCYSTVYKQAYEQIDFKGQGLAYDPENMKAYALISRNGKKSLRSFNLRLPQRYTKFAKSKNCVDGNKQNPLKNQLNGKELYDIGNKSLRVKEKKCAPNGSAEWFRGELTGSKYRGCQTQSISGLACGDWREGPFDGKDFNINDKLEQQIEDGNMDHNYCRNVDGAKTIWCFTLREKRFEACKQIVYKKKNRRDHYNFISFAPMAFRHPIITKQTTEYVQVDQYVFNTTFELEDGHKVWSAEFVPICDDKDRECQIRQYKAKENSASIENFHAKIVKEKKEKRCKDKKTAKCEDNLGPARERCSSYRKFAKDNCAEYCGWCGVSKLPKFKKGSKKPLYHPNIRYFPEADTIIKPLDEEPGEGSNAMSTTHLLAIIFLLF